MKIIRALGLAALAALFLTTGAQAQSCEGGFASSFELKGKVDKASTFRLKDLKKFPSTRVTVSYFSGSEGLVTKTYVGAPLLDVINAAGVQTDPDRKNDILRKYVAVAATDCYESIIAVADLLPNFGAQTVILAYADGEGEPLDEFEGMARLVIAGDKQGGRLVSNVKTVAVRSAPNK